MDPESDIKYTFSGFNWFLIYLDSIQELQGRNLFGRVVWDPHPMEYNPSMIQTLNSTENLALLQRASMGGHAYSTMRAERRLSMCQTQTPPDLQDLQLSAP